ncbi:hypothetical protein BKA81DRAFT_69439 [Phyllosticta paracitricarpa]|uniref:Secreted protein n=1 Tax=Phyllosticta paracitricarpa TaxID=2016321 RepID=A0ABR1N5G0_9PEZI
MFPRLQKPPSCPCLWNALWGQWISLSHSPNCAGGASSTTKPTVIRLSPSRPSQSFIAFFRLRSADRLRLSMHGSFARSRRSGPPRQHMTASCCGHASSYRIRVQMVSLHILQRLTRLGLLFCAFEIEHTRPSARFLMTCTVACPVRYHTNRVACQHSA